MPISISGVLLLDEPPDELDPPDIDELPDEELACFLSLFCDAVICF